MREDSATGRDSTIRSYLHYLLILYLTWIFPFHMGCSVESKAAVRATHESAVMSCLGGLWSAVRARWCHWIPVLTQSSNGYFNTHLQPLGTHSNTLLTCAGSLFASLAWKGRHKTLVSGIPACPHSPSFPSSLHFKQQSSGPSEIQKSLYKLLDCRSTSDAWCRSELKRAKPAL